MCAALAAAALKRPARDDAARLTFAVRRCIARTPTEDELEVLSNFLIENRELFAQPQQAEQAIDLLGTSDDDRPHTDGVSAGELASWIAVSRVILNLDETITKE